MGLGLNVGMLADLLENDPEGAEWFVRNVDNLNSLLASHGLERHEEPRKCECWSCDMLGYRGLHYLRRYAAHLELNGSPPEPGGDESGDDPILGRYYESHGNSKAPGVVPKTDEREQSRSFKHLILHSDAEGFYVPVEFPNVIVAPDVSEIPGGFVGSSHQLLKECRLLAHSLELPSDVDADSDELYEAAENQGVGHQRWQRYGVESYSCVQLMTAARKSIELSALLVFA